MTLGPWTYMLIFATSLAMGLVLTPMALRLAHKTGVLDHPGAHKGHLSPMPYLGGLAIVIAFSLAVLGAAAAAAAASVGGFEQLAAVLGVAILLSVLGLVDDLKGIGATARFVGEAAAGLTIWAAGVRVNLFPFEAADLIVTVVWIVGITNAFNLLDNMDGLSAGVASIAALSFFLIAALNGQFLVAALSVALAGCALGFLRSNFHPARIYMGDAGSLFLGFILAVVAIKLRFAGPTQVTFFVPILVLGVAIFDTTLVVATRLIHRRNPFLGGRDHTSHRLVLVGLQVPVAVALIYAGAVALSWIALVMTRVDRATGFLLMGFVLTVGLFLGLLLGRVPVYETSRRRHLMLREVVPHEVEPRPEIGVPSTRLRGTGTLE